MKLKLKRYIQCAVKMAQDMQKNDDIDLMRIDASKLEGYLRACDEMFRGNYITIIETDPNLFHSD